MVEAMRKAFPEDSRADADEVFVRRGIFIDGWVSAEKAHGIGGSDE